MRWDFDKGGARVGSTSMRFGDFHLDTGARQLLRAGQEIHISPKAFELLQLLVEHRTRAVAKAEIHDRLWPGTFVSEANLSSLIAELRRALDDPPQSSTYIRTVHRFGYAFRGAVEETPADARPSARACWLVWNGREIPLAEGENVVGRDADVAVPLDSPSVSRRHARIVVSGASATLEDLGSKNGTTVRNAPVASAVALNDLDELQIGSVRVVIRIMRGGETTETVER
jgi:DNA-binding winged helix-turn-helix (wHTH) protein